MTATFQTSIFSQKWRVWWLWPARPLRACALTLQLWCSSRDTPAIRSSDKSTPVFVHLLSAAVTGGAGQVLLVKMAISWEKSTSTHLSSLPKCQALCPSLQVTWLLSSPPLSRGRCPEWLGLSNTASAGSAPPHPQTWGVQVTFSWRLHD